MSTHHSHDIAQTIALLFSRSPEAAGNEAEMEVMTDAIIRDFLDATHVSSDSRYASIADSFMESVIPAEPDDIHSYLDYVTTNLVAHSTRTSSPRFIGHMTSMLPFFVRPLAKLMATMNQNVVKAETAKAATPFERQAIAMMHRLVFGFPSEFYREHVQRTQSTLGAIASGGTLANFHALWCARNRALGPKPGFNGVESEGVAAALQAHGVRDAVIIGSELMHYSLDKAAGLLGMGTSNLVKVPVDRFSRVDCALMRRAVENARRKNQSVVALVGVAGATDTGAIDPLPQIADLAAEFQTHFHVDAAWGGPVLFSRQSRRKLTGIERADSVTIDGHKQLYLPMGIGVTLFRDPATARAAEKQARYIIRPNSVDLGKRTVEGSRPNAALYLHAGLTLIGAAGYEYLIDQGIGKAAYLAARLNSTLAFELLMPPEINIVVYRYIPESLRESVASQRLTAAGNELLNECNTTLQKLQRQSGRSFVSRTLLTVTPYGPVPGVVALRVVLANPLTTYADIDAVLAEQMQIGERVSASLPLQLRHAG